MASQAVKKTTAPKSEAVAALEAEATGADNITIDFRGEVLTIDPEDLDDYELMELLIQGLPFQFLNVLIPDADQRARLLGTCEKTRRGTPKLSGAMLLANDLAEALGAGK